MAQFRPVPKCKKYTPRHLANVDPLPVDSVDGTQTSPFVGTFTGLAVEVRDPVAIVKLSRDGCFGQGATSRSFPLAGENLCLCLEEALFLVRELRVLEVRTLDGDGLGEGELIRRFSVIKRGFVSTYVAFMYFKARNWIVKSGLKFGGDFLLYQKGPQFNHASYIVIIQSYQNDQSLPIPSANDLDTLDFHCINRIAETTAKDLLLLEIHYPEDVDPADSKTCFDRLADFKICELFPKHYNYDGARSGQ